MHPTAVSPQQATAILQEGHVLINRFQNASPAEQAQFEARAAELHTQLSPR
jgi:hypothetical protein